MFDQKKNTRKIIRNKSNQIKQITIKLKLIINYINIYTQNNFLKKVFKYFH